MLVTTNSTMRFIKLLRNSDSARRRRDVVPPSEIKRSVGPPAKIACKLSRFAAPRAGDAFRQLLDHQVRARCAMPSAWLGYAWMRAIVHLPFGWQTRARQSAWPAACALCARRAAASPRATSKSAFRSLPPDERADCWREHFAGARRLDRRDGHGWFGSARRSARKRIRIEGAEHLRAALDKGSGVILFSAHFTTFEFFWPAPRAALPAALRHVQVRSAIPS